MRCRGRARWRGRRARSRRRCDALGRRRCGRQRLIGRKNVLRQRCCGGWRRDGCRRCHCLLASCCAAPHADQAAARPRSPGIKVCLAGCRSANVFSAVAAPHRSFTCRLSPAVVARGREDGGSPLPPLLYCACEQCRRAVLCNNKKKCTNATGHMEIHLHMRCGLRMELLCGANSNNTQKFSSHV